MGAELRRPYVMLELGDEEHMLHATWNHEKEITIRAGHRDYRVGDKLAIVNYAWGFAVRATVSAVRHCTLAEVTDEEMNADGWTDRDRMLLDLQRFYDGMTWESPVTVIRWRDAWNPGMDLEGDEE